MANSDNNLIAKFSAAANSQNPSQLQPSAPNQLNYQTQQQNGQTNNLNQPSNNPLDIPKICFNHNQEEGKYFCAICFNWRCPQCVKVYGGVAVCPDSDSFCLTIEKIQEQLQTKIKKNITYKSTLINAGTFPFRNYLGTLASVLMVWGIASFIQVMTHLADSPSIKKIFLGSMVDFSACFICFLLLSSIATQYLINRVQGKETLKFVNFTESKDFSEPILLWVCAASVSLFPITVHLGYSSFQMAIVSIATNIPIKSGPVSLKFYVIAFILSLWAVICYPISLASAGLQRSLLSTINLINLYSVWQNFKEWLFPAIGVFYLLHAICFALMFFLWNSSYGLGIASCAFTLTTISSFMIIGAAIEYGAEKHHEQEQRERELEKEFKQQQEQQQNQPEA